MAALLFVGVQSDLIGFKIGDGFRDQSYGDGIVHYFL
jgi:hypothetical protein